MTARRGLALGLGLGLALALPALAQERQDPGLLRLEAALEKQLSRRKGALPLPWRESILTPASERLVWRARSLVVHPGGDVFRVALDPTTRWYFVVQANGGGRPRFFGPLEEAAMGVFVESFAAPKKAAPAPAKKPALR
jgi:hypothetical protein